MVYRSPAGFGRLLKDPYDWVSIGRSIDGDGPCMAGVSNRRSNNLIDALGRSNSEIQFMSFSESRLFPLALTFSLALAWMANVETARANKRE